MVYIYKNFLIIDRAEKIPAAVNMARSLNSWFQDHYRVWHAKSPGDKIILIYREAFRNDDTIREYTNEADVDFRPQTFLGYIQIYCQATNIKVGDYKFVNGILQGDYWKMFKKYLIQTIKNSGINPQRLQQHIFTLYWDHRICNRQFQNMLEMLGLISDKDKKTYVFKPQDMEEKQEWGGWSPNGWNTPNLTSQPASNGWGTNWGNPASSALPPANPFLKKYGT